MAAGVSGAALQAGCRPKFPVVFPRFLGLAPPRAGAKSPRPYPDPIAGIPASVSSGRAPHVRYLKSRRAATHVRLLRHSTHARKTPYGAARTAGARRSSLRAQGAQGSTSSRRTSATMDATWVPTDQAPRSARGAAARRRSPWVPAVRLLRVERAAGGRGGGSPASCLYRACRSSMRTTACSSGCAAGTPGHSTAEARSCARRSPGAHPPVWSVSRRDGRRFRGCWHFSRRRSSIRWARSPIARRTERATAYPDVPDEVKRDRLEELLEVQQSRASARPLRGYEARVLVDRMASGRWCAHVGRVPGRRTMNRVTYVATGAGRLPGAS